MPQIKLPPGAKLVDESSMKLPPGATLVSDGSAPPQDQEPAQTVPQKLLGGIGNVAVGAGKGLLNTVHGVSGLINKIPGVGETLAPSSGMNAMEKMSTPKGLAQKAGYYGEQAAEFLLPGPAEEKAGLMLAEHAPQLGKLARPIGRIAGQVASNAAIDKAQGGDASTGAIGGLIGGGLGEGMRSVAPAIAESALGITKRMRGYGKTPGAAVLDEIKGVRPSTIMKNAGVKIGGLTDEAENMAAAHPGMISLKPAIGSVDSAIAKASSRNEGSAIQQIGGVRDFLTKRAVSGVPIATDQSATNALNLKRGLRDTFVKNWNPEVHAAVPAVAKQASRSIDNGLDLALGPKFADVNQRISSLIPVAERAESLERGASIPQRIAHRMAAHTGALVGAGVGAGAGYNQGGIPGAIGGGLLGIAGPEILASPTAQMVFARALHSGVPAKLAIGSALQLAKRSEDAEDKEKSDKR